MPQIPEERLLELCDLGFWYLCVMMLSLITLAYPVVSRIPVHVVTGKLFSILFPSLLNERFQVLVKMPPPHQVLLMELFT